eukprot:10423582-Lingulodinium_polyedra.AAC.1
MAEQIHGKYLQTVAATLDLLSDAGVLASIGMHRTFYHPDALDFSEDQPAVVRDDDFAEHFGSLIMELA